jgi:putative ATP-dependent endonuclease of the OLD family
MIEKVIIHNYRTFREFELSFSPGLNTVVGGNDAGKSTLIEALNLALTGRVNGRPFSQSLSPYFINLDATADYTTQLRSDASHTTPPELIVDLFLRSDDDTELLRGTNNLAGEDACGLRIQAKLSSDFAEEYERFIEQPTGVGLVPTEYYKVEWLGFSGNGVTYRSVPATASVIDSTSIRLQSGIDYHLQQIINTQLAPNERVELSRQYRSLREEFSNKDPVREINDRLRRDNDGLTDRNFSLSVDISQRYTWESSLTAHIDDLPFQFVGSGEQNAVKTLLAIGQHAGDANVVLIEEPETHLSFPSLRKLIARIETQCVGKQVIVATHSAYVLNKLGLENLVLLANGTSTRLTDVPEATTRYFKRLAGFDTLRLVLAAGAILVEGPSDELIVQRAYLDAKGRLPIDDGIDVISVGLSHKRFLDIAVRLKRRVWIVTDNDGKSSADVESRFADYLTHEFVTLFPVLTIRTNG